MSTRCSMPTCIRRRSRPRRTDPIRAARRSASRCISRRYDSDRGYFMPFIPHTELEVREMLDSIGVRRIDELFDEIPAALRTSLKEVPAGLAEMDVARLMKARAAADDGTLCFIGAGAYRHHIPAAVWELTTRGEYYAAYTPYQAEASQGTLQLLYEYQAMMAGLAGEDYAALVIPQPNFFGALEEVDALTDWAHAHNVFVIGVVNPTSLALLTPPGEWGAKGADIACGEGQPLGAPLSAGGPYFGFMCCRQEWARQMPGRIVGRTVDVEGKPGFTLTLQAREQHIRRSKATSNICTNQGLVVTAATIYMSLVGAEGLARVAAASHANTARLKELLAALPGVSAVFSGPCFHETVLRLPRPADEVLAALAARGIAGGFNLKHDYPELGEATLVCATETKYAADLDAYRSAHRSILEA